MKEGAKTKEGKQALEMRKDKELDSLLQPQKSTQLCLHLDDSPVKTISDFWHPELLENMFVWFEANKLMAFYCSTHREPVRSS